MQETNHIKTEKVGGKKYCFLPAVPPSWVKPEINKWCRENFLWILRFKETNLEINAWCKK